MFTEYILGELLNIYNRIGEIGVNDNLLKSLEQFSSGIYNGISLIRDNVITPVAYTILGLFILLEIHHIVVRFEGNQGTMGIELPLKVMFKAVLYKLVIDNVGLIMEAFFNVSLDLTRQIQGVLTTGQNDLLVNYNAIERAVDSLSFGQGLMTAIYCFVIGLVVSIALTIVNVIVIARFFEIYVFMAVSPLPIATLPHNEMSSIAKNFFKNFAAVCLHGVFIYLILAMMPMLARHVMLNSVDGTNFQADILKILGYCFVLIVSLTASSRWAKSICNAM